MKTGLYKIKQFLEKQTYKKRAFDFFVETKVKAKESTAEKVAAKKETETASKMTKKMSTEEKTEAT